MHERHVKRAVAIVGTTGLLSNLGGIINDYLIATSHVDKMADLVAMQLSNTFQFTVWGRLYVFSWKVVGDDPRDYTYSVAIHYLGMPGRIARSLDPFTLDRIVAIAGLMSVQVSGLGSTFPTYMGDHGLDSFTTSLCAILADI